MARCELLATCIFFNDGMPRMPKTADAMKRRYCENDNFTCARYIVLQARGQEAVPDDLYPSDIDAARALLR